MSVRKCHQSETNLDHCYTAECNCISSRRENFDETKHSLSKNHSVLLVVSVVSGVLTLLALWCNINILLLLKIGSFTKYNESNVSSYIVFPCISYIAL